MDNGDFWNEENRAALHYLKARINHYDSQGRGLDLAFFGVNGERPEMEETRIRQVNMLSFASGRETLRTIDYLFSGNPGPEEVLLRLRQSDAIYTETAGNPREFSLSRPRKKIELSFSARALEKAQI
jgi:hypothetical protein